MFIFIYTYSKQNHFIKATNAGGTVGLNMLSDHDNFHAKLHKIKPNEFNPVLILTMNTETETNVRLLTENIFQVSDMSSCLVIFMISFLEEHYFCK